VAPLIFIHGTNVVDRGLIVLFSVMFCYFSVFYIFPSRYLDQESAKWDLFGFRVKLPPVSTIHLLIGRGNPVKCLVQRHNK